jgi:hypothetical protein
MTRKIRFERGFDQEIVLERLYPTEPSSVRIVTLKVQGWNGVIALRPEGVEVGRNLMGVYLLDTSKSVVDRTVPVTITSLRNDPPPKRVVWGDQEDSC